MIFLGAGIGGKTICCDGGGGVVACTQPSGDKGGVSLSFASDSSKGGDEGK